jgi:membrane associated rhomboid family serine protease
MLFLIPTSTDAPIYHPPIATGAIIVANVLAFILQFSIPGFTEQWELNFGSFNPIHWLSCAYLHGDFFHLFNNMLFLFIFGLIVEGKIGWWRFAIVYNACAIAASILISIVTVAFSEGSCLGASCAIFGIMIIAFLWAPENEIHFKFFVIFFFRPYGSAFDISVSTLTYVFVALNFAVAAMSGFGISSAVLHLLGIPFGVAIGWGMLAARRVNCDGHDFISIMTGKRGQEQLTVEEIAARDERRKELAREKREQLAEGLKMVTHYVDKGHYEVGFKRFESLARKREGLVLDESLLVKMINGLEKQPDQTKLYRKLLKYYAAHYQRLKVNVTFKLAKLLIQKDYQPRKAIKELQRLDQSTMSPSEQKMLAKLARVAKNQIAAGAIEIQQDID